MPNFNSYTYLQAKSMLNIISLQVCTILVFGEKSKVNTLTKRITKSKQAPQSLGRISVLKALLWPPFLQQASRESGEKDGSRPKLGRNSHPRERHRPKLGREVYPRESTNPKLGRGS